MRFADLEGFAPYDRLRELAEADKDGRVVVLPCKVGDTVYRVFNPPGREPVISAHTLMSVDYIVRWLDKFGKTVFLTREEAEKALEGERNGGVCDADEGGLTMAEYIEKSVAIARLTALEIGNPCATMADAKRQIADTRPADVSPVVHARWLDAPWLYYGAK